MKTRRKLGNRNIRKITKKARGSSYSITLPIDVIRQWNWKERQKVILTVNDKEKSIKIQDWKKK